jgi:hypothetical protein
VLAYEPGFATFVTQPDLLDAHRADADAAWGPVFAARKAGDEEGMVRAMYDASGGPGAYDRLSADHRAIVSDSAGAIPRLLDQTPPVPISCNDLGTIPISTSIAWGLETRPCFKIPAEAATRCVTSGAFQIEGVGHLWPATHPEAFCRLVDFWMNKLPEGPAD